MGKWVDIKGPVVADTVYSDNVLVAKDTSFTLPGIEFLTADVQAMGTMTVPLIGLLENMELSDTKIGVDNGLSRLNTSKSRTSNLDGCRALSARTAPSLLRAARRSCGRCRAISRRSAWR